MLQFNTYLNAKKKPGDYVVKIKLAFCFFTIVNNFIWLNDNFDQSEQS